MGNKEWKKIGFDFLKDVVQLSSIQQIVIEYKLEQHTITNEDKQVTTNRYQAYLKKNLSALENKKLTMLLKTLIFGVCPSGS